MIRWLSGVYERYCVQFLRRALKWLTRKKLQSTMILGHETFVRTLAILDVPGTTLSVRERWRLARFAQLNFVLKYIEREQRRLSKHNVKIRRLGAWSIDPQKKGL